MPKLYPSPLMLQEARENIAGHIIRVESIVRLMSVANARLEEISAEYPVIFGGDRGILCIEMHQIKVSSTTTAWRSQLTWLRRLAVRLKEEEEKCRSSFSSSLLPSQSGTQPTSMKDTPNK